MVPAVLKAKFREVPVDIEKMVCGMVDMTAMKSSAAQAATCQSLAEFVGHLS